MPSHHTSQPSPQAPSVGLSQSSSTKRMSCTQRVDADAAEALQVEVLEVRRRRLHDHLELVVVLQPVGVLAVAAVLGPARGLHVGRVPGLGAERAQGGGRVEGAGAHLHVVGLQDHAALLAPELLQRQDQVLERLGRPQAAAAGPWRCLRCEPAWRLSSAWRATRGLEGCGAHYTQTAPGVIRICATLGLKRRQHTHIICVGG